MPKVTHPPFHYVRCSSWRTGPFSSVEAAERAIAGLGPFGNACQLPHAVETSLERLFTGNLADSLEWDEEDEV